MLKKLFLLIIPLCVLFLVASVALADETDLDADYPWRFHAGPFSFKFYNQIDSHQQSRIVDGGKLQGFLYIHYTGEYTDDGLPVAERAKCPHLENLEDCRVGWILTGVPISATLVTKSPRIWSIDLADLPREPGYNHFQWLGEPHTPHELVIGLEYPGMLLKRIAPEPFFWLGGSGSSGSGGGGCGGHDGGDTGGCSGDTGDCDSGSTDDTGGCTGHDTGDIGGCDSGSAGGCDSGSTGGCDSGSTGDTGGCGGHDTGDTGGCGGSGGPGGGGHTGRIVPEGVDPHTNVVTDWDGNWTGGGGCGGHDGGDSGGCSDDTGGCTGHDSGDTGTDPDGCTGTDGGSCTG